MGCPEVWGPDFAQLLSKAFSKSIPDSISLLNSPQSGEVAPMPSLVLCFTEEPSTLAPLSGAAACLTAASAPAESMRGGKERRGAAAAGCWFLLTASRGQCSRRSSSQWVLETWGAETQGLHADGSLMELSRWGGAACMHTCPLCAWDLGQLSKQGLAPFLCWFQGCSLQLTPSLPWLGSSTVLISASSVVPSPLVVLSKL